MAQGVTFYSRGNPVGLSFLDVRMPRAVSCPGFPLRVLHVRIAGSVNSSAYWLSRVSLFTLIAQFTREIPLPPRRTFKSCTNKSCKRLVAGR